MHLVRRVALAALAVVLLPVSAAAATDRYIAPSGGPSPFCSDPLNPCNNLDWVLDRTNPGDTIYFYEGTYSDAAMASRTIDVPNVTIRGARWGESAVGRTGEESLIPAEPGGTSLSVVVDGVEIDGLAFADGSDTALYHSEPVAVRGTILEADDLGVGAAPGAATPLTLETSVVEAGTPVFLWGGASAIRDNVITATLAGEAAITAVADGVEITGNDLRGPIGIALDETVATAEIHGNRLPADGVGIASETEAPVDAEDNWWGCNGGAGAPLCASVGGTGVAAIDADPWLVFDAYAQPDQVGPGGEAMLHAWPGVNSDRVETGLGTWPATTVAFTAEAGSLSSPTSTLAMPTARVTWTAPGAPGVVDWTATLDNQTVERTVSVAPPPVADVQPRTIAFGGQGVGTQSLPETVEVENTGGSPLVISRLDGKGTGSSLFRVSNDTCTGATVASGASCTFDVRFGPAGLGSWTPSIEVVSNAAKRAVRLSGQGVPRVTAEPSPLEFRTVPGETGVGDLVLMNNTDDPIDIASWTVRGQGKSLFGVTDISCPLTIAPRSYCTFRFEFHPQALGRWDLTATFAFGPGQGPTVTVPISGDGVRPARVDPRGYDFGEIAIGTSSSQSFTVTNQSTSSLTIDSHKEGAGRSQFSIDPDTCLGAVLAPGGSCSFIVRFHPTTEGSWSPTIVVTTPTRSTTVEVSGSGVD